jgi:monoamine oxidase
VTDTTVAVVGGGLAGLCAAHRLHQAGVDCRLYEARDRLGGRILTVDPHGRPSVDGFDLGPSWVWPSVQPALATLIAELGLSVFPQTLVGDALFERTANEAALRYSGQTTDIESMRVVGGTTALVAALAQQLPPDRIHVGTRVQAIALTESGVSLTVAGYGARADTINARAVILAAPPRLLASAIHFTPPQPPEVLQRWRLTPTWMAPTAKVLAVYATPFWRHAGLSGGAQSLVGPLAEIHDASTVSGQYALFGFLKWTAQQRAALGVPTLKQACLDQLTRLFGPSARETLAVHVQDWTTEPWTATELDAVASGHPMPSSMPWTTRPWQERLALAGSESSPTDPGYLSGAVVGAERAAQWAIRR